MGFDLVEDCCNRNKIAYCGTCVLNGSGHIHCANDVAENNNYSIPYIFAFFIIIA